MRVRYLILHCSDTEDGPGLSWPAIRRYHMEERGWSDIGYHYGIERYGPRIAVLRGRPPWVRGAHCRAAGRNRDSLGVCVVGKFDEDPPSLGVYDATVQVLARLAWAFHIEPDRVAGHREFDKRKTCPGLKWDLDKLREDIMREMVELASGNAVMGDVRWLI